jgi:cobyrinic acid a,c-diamide synthase
MTDRLTLGYRTATTTRPSPLGPAGLVFRGHEFHYSHIDPEGDALQLEGRMGVSHGGHSGPTVLASYVHVHLAGKPELAEAFVAACADGAGPSISDT